MTQHRRSGQLAALIVKLNVDNLQTAVERVCLPDKGRVVVDLDTGHVTTFLAV